MKKFYFAFCAIAITFIAAPVSAAIQYRTYYDMDVTGPVIQSCIAYSSLLQKCKKCHENVSDDGKTSAGWVCRAVTESSSCQCQSSNEQFTDCTPQGTCTYR